MITEPNLGKKIDQADKSAQYDSCAKRLLSEKIVLAFILKHAVAEFAPYSLEEIRDCYIEGVEVESRGVDVDETNVEIVSRTEGSSIEGKNVESVTKTEGKVFYDIIFDVIVPSTKQPIRLIINIEAQKDASSKYVLITRGIYYCGRMISAQKGRIFEGSDYNKLRKVYSIWICMNPDPGSENTMNMYPITEQQIIGNYTAEKESYDKATVVIINLSSKGTSEQPLLKFLETLLSNTKEPEEKRQELLENYGIDTTPEMDKEMTNMCNLGQSIAEEGMRIGMERGRAEGEARGVIKMCKSLKMSADEIAAKLVDMLKMSPAQARETALMYA